MVGVELIDIFRYVRLLLDLYARMYLYLWGSGWGCLYLSARGRLHVIGSLCGTLGVICAGVESELINGIFLHIYLLTIRASSSCQQYVLFG